MEENLFNDLISACHEAIEYENGNINLNTNTVTVSDDEIEQIQLLCQRIMAMSPSNRQRVAGYIDGLLQVAG
jgi:hypothetical protein